ncbi:MAG: galactokinase [Oligoflexia bacterium]|nr:galactokinase [Oligoflexia bacterium]
MKKITAKSPTRIDLAGGTLDLWPLYLFHKDSVTINLAIDIYTYATLIPRRDKKIILHSQDTSQKAEYLNLKELINDKSDDLKLLKVHATYWAPKQGFELVTKSESPIGAGISASSSLGISLCGVFSKLLKKKYIPEKLIKIAQNLEAQVVKTPTGCQDYFPCYFGGLNMIELTPEGPKHKKLKLNLNEFLKHFTLVYTGRPHHSGLNNWQIYKSQIEGIEQTHEKLEQIRDVALEMKEAVVKKSIKNLGPIFENEYEARVALSPVFTSPEIEKLKKLVISNGGESVKICGAGGGGCVFIWSEPAKKSMLEMLCAQHGFQVLKAKPVEKGLKIS